MWVVPAVLPGAVTSASSATTLQMVNVLKVARREPTPYYKLLNVETVLLLVLPAQHTINALNAKPATP